MQPHLYLRVLRHETGALAASAARRLDDAVPTYPGWTVADLVVHTSHIHRWVTEIVRTRATDRLRRSDAAPPEHRDDLLDWFIGGSEELATTLADTDPATAVWTFAGDGTAGFWRRRMALETTIHRWDCQRAAGRPGPLGPDIALEGIDEALRVYLEPRLAGRELGGAGQHVRLRCADSDARWVVRLDAASLTVVDPADSTGDDATITAPADRLWLFLMGRAALDELAVDGDDAAAALCAHVVALLPAPRR